MISCYKFNKNEIDIEMCFLIKVVELLIGSKEKDLLKITLLILFKIYFNGITYHFKDCTVIFQNKTTNFILQFGFENIWIENS